MRGLDTITEWGEKLIRQHRPPDLLALPDFIRPQELPKSPSAVPVSELHAAIRATTPTAPQAPTVDSATSDGNVTRKLICARCHCKITFPEGKFCWNNSPRFGGLQYCREHQSLF
jgi:hypothetical protein